MIPADASLADLVELARQGDQEAVQQLLSVYGRHIFRAVRRHMHRRLRPQFDSMDFVQDVWFSFFTGGPDKRTFENAEQLIGLLAAMARNKVVDATRSRLGPGKNAAREVALEEISEQHLPLAQGTPSQNLKEQEEWIAFLKAQPAVHRGIFSMFRSGMAPEAIAAQLNLSSRQVNRILRKILIGSSP
jgi:RNA polymerase sigma-70 factor (ECF subfamily)